MQLATNGLDDVRRGLALVQKPSVDFIEVFRVYNAGIVFVKVATQITKDHEGSDKVFDQYKAAEFQQDTTNTRKQHKKGRGCQGGGAGDYRKPRVF